MCKCRSCKNMFSQIWRSPGGQVWNHEGRGTWVDIWRVSGWNFPGCADFLWQEKALEGKRAKGRLHDGVWRARQNPGGGGRRGSRQSFSGHDGVLPHPHFGCLCPRASLTTEFDSHILVFPHGLILPESLFVCFYVKREVKINLIKSLSDLLGISLCIIARVLDHRHFATQQSLLNQVRAGRTGL